MMIRKTRRIIMDHEKFEYKIVAKYTYFFSSEVDAKEAEKTFNALGVEGWELVSLMDIQNRTGRSKAINAIFKRKIIE